MRRLVQSDAALGDPKEARVAAIADHRLRALMFEGGMFITFYRPCGILIHSIPDPAVF
jgi:hypothetical protein